MAGGDAEALAVGEGRHGADGERRGEGGDFPRKGEEAKEFRRLVGRTDAGQQCTARRLDRTGGEPDENS